MNLITDTVGIRSCRCNQKVQRLCPGITGSFRHDIVELSIRLGMKFIKDHTGGIKSMLVCYIGGEHLIGTVGRKVDQLFLGFQNLHTLIKSGAEAHHIDRNVIDNFCLIAVRSAAINLSAFLAISAGKKKGDRSGQF